MEQSRTTELLDVLSDLYSMQKDLFTSIGELHSEIRIWKGQTDTKHSSSERGELFSALAKAQAQMKLAQATRKNRYTAEHYADLPEVIHASREALANNNLAVIQQLLPNDDDMMMLHTILTHSSGQWIESQVRLIPIRDDVQAFNSQVVYLRRMAYAALLGVTIAGEDDDGEMSMTKTRGMQEKGTALNAQYDPREDGETITKEQLDELEYEIGPYHHIAAMILKTFKIQQLCDMPKSRYRASLQKVREIRNGLENAKPGELPNGSYK